MYTPTTTQEQFELYSLTVVLQVASFVVVPQSDPGVHATGVGAVGVGAVGATGATGVGAVGVGAVGVGAVGAVGLGLDGQ